MGLPLPNVAFWTDKKLAASSKKHLPHIRKIRKKNISATPTTLWLRHAAGAGNMFRKLALLLHLVFSSLSLALETCWFAVRRLAFVFLISFASALLVCSLLSSFVCFPLSGSCSLLLSCPWLIVMSFLTRSPLPSAGSADISPFIIFKCLRQARRP